VVATTEIKKLRPTQR